MNKYKVFSFGLSIIIVILLAVIGLQKFYHYKEKVQFRLDPLEENNRNTSIDFKKKKFWIVGDSRASAWDTSYFPFLPATKINLGIGGQSSKQVLERFKNDLESAKPSHVLIQVGINDLKSIPFLKDKRITQNCINNIIEMLEICKKNQIQVIYTSIFPVGDIELLRRPLWQNDVNDSIQKVNNVIKTYCSDNGMLYFDANMLLIQNDGPIVKQEFQHDFLHLNERGYEYLSKKLQVQLQQDSTLFPENNVIQ